MAESGIISGLIGGDSESAGEAAAAEAALDPTAAAMATDAVKRDPELAQDVSAYFRKQTHLVELQTEHLHEQRAVNLTLLKIKRFGEWLRVGLQLFGVFVATALCAGGVIMVRDAVKSHGVVIEPFEISPDLSAHALSGRIVASGLLDRLTQLQAATRSSAERRSLSNAWTNELSIEVPETGLSLGQIARVLKTRFGHDQHIDGDLVNGEKGALDLTLRGDGILPHTFTDASGKLDQLLTEASEYLFSQSQPGLWAAYLSNNDRVDDAIRFCQSTYSTADASERPFLLNYWANALTEKRGLESRHEALTFYQEAVRLKPDYWDGYNNIMDSLQSLGDEEGVVREGNRMKTIAGGRPGKAPEEDYQNLDILLYDLGPFRASLVGDLDAHGGVGANGAGSGSEAILVAAVDVLLHDLDSAALRIETTQVSQSSAPDMATMAFAQARLAAERGDFKRAGEEWTAYAGFYAKPEVASDAGASPCWAAATFERLGLPNKADEALNAVGSLTYVDCYRFRADLLDQRGDWTAAQEWYAKAVELGPSIPSGYYSWGVALIRHGDLNGALEKLKLANQKSPHWAEPLKSWGDVLAKQNRTREALMKYDDALTYAPHWVELKAARAALGEHKT